VLLIIITCTGWSGEKFEVRVGGFRGVTSEKSPQESAFGQISAFPGLNRRGQALLSITGTRSRLQSATQRPFQRRIKAGLQRVRQSLIGRLYLWTSDTMSDSTTTVHEPEPATTTSPSTLRKVLLLIIFCGAMFLDVFKYAHRLGTIIHRSPSLPAVRRSLVV